MTEVEIVRIPVAPSNMERLVAAFVEGRAGYLAPPACLAIELLAPDDGTTLVAMLRWASPAAHAAAFATPEAQSFLAHVGELASAPPSVERTRAIYVESLG
ncbi:MAG: antibiotic biosynthesis monooxygenase [Steroidobacteraceae bacterium]